MNISVFDDGCNKGVGEYNLVFSDGSFKKGVWSVKGTKVADTISAMHCKLQKDVHARWEIEAKSRGVGWLVGAP